MLGEYNVAREKNLQGQLEDTNDVIDDVHNRLQLLVAAHRLNKRRNVFQRNSTGISKPRPS